MRRPAMPPETQEDEPVGETGPFSRTLRPLAGLLQWL